MGLLDKLKGVFFEEEYVEVEEPVKKEKVTVAKKIEPPEVKKVKEVKDAVSSSSEAIFNADVKKEPKVEVESDKEKDFKFPMNFDDKDFEVEERRKPSREEVKKIEERPIYQEKSYNSSFTVEKEEVPYRSSEASNYHNNNYQGLYEGSDKKDKKQFTPSLVISPVYGILDKNYKKEEIVTRKEVRISAMSSRKVDLDSVREKAYGDLATEITESIHEEVKKDETNPIDEENLLYDLNESSSPAVKVVTMGDAEEYFNDLGLEYNVDYKVEKEKKEDKPIAKRRVDRKKEQLDDDKVIDLEENLKEESTDNDNSNLFDLIDSMYEDKEW